ncbi:MAG: hypothetical protein L0229_22710 [Blastocatellia bacterium]|nr:hypothetical protein [Blastocatellia bacterium]
MLKRFETERYDLVKADKVRVANFRFGRNRQGERDVWIETSDKGERFLSQIIVPGETYSVRKEIYTKKCYILREKATGRYWFLDMNDCGFWLQNETLSGAETFSGDEAVKIQKWLDDATPIGRLAPAFGYKSEVASTGGK